MPRHTLSASLRCLAAAVLLVAAGSAARAANPEVRTFAVSVDGKPAGTYQMSVGAGENGSTVMTGRADVRVKIRIINYTYAYRGTEIWKDGRLLRLDSTCDDHGKRHGVSAVAGREGLVVKADGREYAAPADAWVTSYWQSPEVLKRGADVRLLDADTGRPIRAKLEKVGVEQRNISGQAVNCAHFRLSGGVQVDLWYDATGRLVRQESIEDGHRTVLELSAIQN